eukprot:jgi/Chlat1/5665/Chrsp37S09014
MTSMLRATSSRLAALRFWEKSLLCRPAQLDLDQNSQKRKMELCTYGPDGMAYLHQSGGYEGQGGKSGISGIRSHVLKLGNVRQWCPKPFW